MSTLLESITGTEMFITEKIEVRRKDQTDITDELKGLYLLEHMSLL